MRIAASGAQTGSWLSSRPSSIWNSGVTSVDLLSGRRHRVRMRPIGAPDDAVGIRRDQRLGERRRVRIIGRQFRGPIGAGDLHIGLARPHQFRRGRQNPAAPTPSSACAPPKWSNTTGTGEAATRSLIAEIIARLVYIWMCQSRVFDALDPGLKARPPDVGIVDAAGCEIEPDAANAGLFMASRSLSGVLSSITATPRAVGAARLHAEQRRGIVRAVDARRDDHHALHMQRLVQGRHFLGRCQFRRIDAAGEERKFLGIAVDVGVAIAGAGRNVEIHRRRGLCCLAQRRFCCSWSLPRRWRQAAYCVASAWSSPLCVSRACFAFV